MENKLAYNSIELLPVVTHPEYYQYTTTDNLWQTNYYHKALQDTSNLEYISPEPVSKEDAQLVHTPEYTETVFSDPNKNYTAWAGGPWDESAQKAVLRSAGGTLRSAQEALQKGVAVHLYDAFHHAYPDRGEGFCVLNDIAIAATKIALTGKKVMVVDTDIHQGQGTAVCAANNPNIFTVSLHEENNYPRYKENSSIDVHLPDKITGKQYLHYLKETLNQAFSTFAPDLVVFVAGTDLYEGDQLSHSKISLQDIYDINNYVLDFFGSKKIPVSMSICPGYAKETEDTLHLIRTGVEQAREAYHKYYSTTQSAVTANVVPSANLNTEELLQLRTFIGHKGNFSISQEAFNYFSTLSNFQELQNLFSQGRYVDVYNMLAASAEGRTAIRKINQATLTARDFMLSLAGYNYYDRPKKWTDRELYSSFSSMHVIHINQFLDFLDDYDILDTASDNTILVALQRVNVPDLIKYRNTIISQLVYAERSSAYEPGKQKKFTASIQFLRNLKDTQSQGFTTSKDLHRALRHIDELKDPQLLHLIATSTSNLYDLIDVCHNHYTSPATLAMLGSILPLSELENVIDNNNTPVSTLEKIFQDTVTYERASKNFPRNSRSDANNTIDRIFLAFGGNEKTPSFILDYALNNYSTAEYTEMLQDIAQHPNLSDSGILRLSTSQNADILALLTRQKKALPPQAVDNIIKKWNKVLPGLDDFTFLQYNILSREQWSRVLNTLDLVDIRDLSREISLPADVLRQMFDKLKASKDPFSALVSLACNANISVDLLHDIVDFALQRKRTDLEDLYYIKELAQAVANSPHTSVPLLRKLIDSRKGAEKTALASPLLPVDTIRHYFEQARGVTDYQIEEKYLGNYTDPRPLQKQMFLGIASNTQTPYDILEFLAKRSDADIRSRVASNPSTTPLIQSWLVADKIPVVALSLLENPNITKENLMLLTKHEKKNVREEARERLKFNDPSFVETLSKEQLKEKGYRGKDSFNHKVLKSNEQLFAYDLDVFFPSTWTRVIYAADNDPFPEELFKSFNLHHMPAAKTFGFGKVLGWIGGGWNAKTKILYVTEMQSDLLQRTFELKNPVFSQFRQYKSQLENYYHGWQKIFFNQALREARSRGANYVYVPTSRTYANEHPEAPAHYYDYVVADYPHTSKFAHEQEWNVIDMKQDIRVAQMLNWNPKLSFIDFEKDNEAAEEILKGTILEKYNTIIFDIDRTILDVFSSTGDSMPAFKTEPPYRLQDENVMLDINGHVIQLQPGLRDLLEILDNANKNLGIVSRSADREKDLPFAALPAVMILKKFDIFKYFNLDIIVKSDINKADYIYRLGKTLFIDDETDNIEAVKEKGNIDVLSRKKFQEWQDLLNKLY